MVNQRSKNTWKPGLFFFSNSELSFFQGLFEKYILTINFVENQTKKDANILES